MSEQFAKIAKSFCSCIDNLRDFDRQTLLDLERRLVEIYSEILKLRPGESCDADSQSISKDQWDALYKKLQNLPLSRYWEVYDPLNDSDHEPVVGVLADDLADIYRDLMGGLSLWEAGNKADSTWHWRFSFVTHWSEHLTGALRALNAYLRKDEIE